MTQVALKRGYQVLYLDYRGTGLSTPIDADALLREGGPQAQADYLKLFRANHIVRDLEAVRLCLTEGLEEHRKPWSIFGQSFGGFVSLTYLSKYPNSLREVFMTGGLAPVKQNADEVYAATYKKVMERNAAYYTKYPEDIITVRQLADHIQTSGKADGINLPSGGKLTVPLFLSIGLAFGGHGGIDEIHSLVLKLATDLDLFGFFTRNSLAAIESQIPFDLNPIYAILHEAIYNAKQKGFPASNWAAHRVGKSLQPFSWLADPAAVTQSTSSSEPLYFSGEMVYPFYFDVCPQLASMKEAAEILASTEEWDEDLYDEEQLQKNEVPVYAVSYIDDMYVDFELARETAALVKGIKVRETNGWYHDAVRSRSDEVFGMLFQLQDDCID